jgi:hypothetical protein
MFILERHQGVPAERQVVCERMDWHHPNRRGYYERYRECIAEAVPLEAALTEDPVQVMFNGPVLAMRALLASERFDAARRGVWQAAHGARESCAH